MITEDILVEKMIEMGTCTGIDRALCIRAIKLVSRSYGTKLPAVRAMLGDDFDNFAKNYRTAFEKIMDMSKIDDVCVDVKPTKPEPQKTSAGSLLDDMT